MGNARGTLKTITGRYVRIANPCTTRPCLPGMVPAVLPDGEPVFITLNGRWQAEDHSWDEYTPRPGDTVTIAGFLQEQQDLFGKPFLTIETVSLKQAK